METPYLTRVRLRRDADVAALAPVLLPMEPDARIGVAHRLMWTLFADHPDRRRDFLWREEGRGDPLLGSGSFLILSRRPPENRRDLFIMEPPKAFEPVLRPGDRLAFALRANPVVSRWENADGVRKRRRHDVVMDRLQGDDASRGGRRFDATLEGGRSWLTRQGERAGFRLPDPEAVRIDGYGQIRLPRGPGRRRRVSANDIRLSVLDLDGILEVREPDAFLSAVAGGFGKAKAFGCGLMLIRRVR